MRQKRHRGRHLEKLYTRLANYKSLNEKRHFSTYLIPLASLKVWVSEPKNRPKDEVFRTRPHNEASPRNKKERRVVKMEMAKQYVSI